MNGNFEYDRGSYPYTATRIGDNTFVLHTPTQQRVLGVPLPHSLAANVALRINTQYHASKAGGPKFDGTARAMVDVFSQELTASVQRGDTAGPNATQIQRLIDAATA